MIVVALSTTITSPLFRMAIHTTLQLERLEATIVLQSMTRCALIQLWQREVGRMIKSSEGPLSRITFTSMPQIFPFDIVAGRRI